MRVISVELGSPHAFLLWILAGVLIVALLNIASVERTQEGRVLEPRARGSRWAGGMTGSCLRLGGELRLKKPPLAYWLAAGSFSLFGVNEWSGRLPFAIASWLMAGLLYHVGAGLFGARVGFLSAGVC